MTKARLWLNVYEKAAPMGANELWTREVIFEGTPRTGDMLYLSVSLPEDGDEIESTVSWYVYAHYWEHDGSYCLELSKMVVDPVNDMISNPRRYWSAWWVDRENGRPEPMLRRGGWVTWAEWKAHEKGAGV